MARPVLSAPLWARGTQTSHVAWVKKMSASTGVAWLAISCFRLHSGNTLAKEHKKPLWTVPFSVPLQLKDVPL